MPASAKLHVGSVGVEVEIPLTDPKGNPVDLSTSTAILLYLRKPGATTSTSKTIGKRGSGATGIALWVTAATDLDVDGQWQAQTRVQYSNPTRDWWSQIYPLPVAANLGP